MRELLPKETSQSAEVGTQTKIATSVRDNTLETVNLTEKTITIAHDADIAVARIVSGKLAEQAGLNNTQKHCVMTSVSELASNIFYHTGAGSVTIEIITRDDGIKGVEIIARDQGKGIPDIDLAMQDGYSTKGGLGGGLPGAKRLMGGNMQISSAPQKGTLIRVVKWEDDHHISWDDYKSPFPA